MSNRFNWRRLFYMFGALLVAESLFMVLSAAVDLLYPADGNGGLTALLLSASITLGVGIVCLIVGRGSSRQIGRREGYTLVGTVWIVLSLLGMLPFLISGAIPSGINAFFEALSGFTTTGTSIIADVEVLPHSLLLWRSLTEWMGGLGIVILSLAVLPFIGGGIQFAMSESTGPTFDKIQPRIGDTARRLWGVYVLLTVIMVGLLMLGGVDAFDAVCHALTTVSSGGYSTKNLSVGFWDSAYIQYVFIFFMIFSGTNFTLLYLAFIKGKFSRMWQNEEWRGYHIMIIAVSIIIGFILTFTRNTASLGDVEQHFRDALFHTTSIISSSGLITSDYSTWPIATTLILLIVMFIGGSSGSTSGGIKVIRLVVVVKNGLLEIRRLLHRNAIIPLRINQRVYPEQTVNSVYVFVSFFILFVFAGSVGLLSCGIEPRTAFEVSLSSLSNVGPIYPIDSFANIPAKCIIMFLMLLGRLEIFAILALFSRSLWKNR